MTPCGHPQTQTSGLPWGLSSPTAQVTSPALGPQITLDPAGHNSPWQLLKYQTPSGLQQAWAPITSQCLQALVAFSDFYGNGILISPMSPSSMQVPAKQDFQPRPTYGKWSSSDEYSSRFLTHRSARPATPVPGSYHSPKPSANPSTKVASVDIDSRLAPTDWLTPSLPKHQSIPHNSSLKANHCAPSYRHTPWSQFPGSPQRQTGLCGQSIQVGSSNQAPPIPVMR